MDTQQLITLLDTSLAAFPVEQAGHLPDGKPAYEVRLETGWTEATTRSRALTIANRAAMRKALAGLHPDPLVAAEIMRPVLWSRGTPWDRRKTQNLREYHALEWCRVEELRRLARLEREAQEALWAAEAEAARTAMEQAAEAKRLREADPEYWL
jgi:hypothetical protein